MPKAEKARLTPALGFVGIDRQGLVIAPARMGDMVLAAAQRPAHPGVEQVEHQRRMHRDGRLQTIGRLPGAITHGGDKLTDPPGWLQG
ncbi:hypothetical protein D9M71_481510 [compost metagenome]